MKKGEGYAIQINTTMAKKPGLTEGSKLQAQLVKDNSPHQLAVTAVFTKVMNTVPTKMQQEAKKVFDGLTPGNQRGLMYLVRQPKSMDKQIDRALIIAKKLKQGISSPRLILWTDK